MITEINNNEIYPDRRTTRWLYDNYSRFDISENNKMNFANNMDKIISVLNDIYHDNWDFIFNDNFIHNASYMSIILYFDEIDIVNSNNLHHIIKDLFVIIPLNIYYDKIIINEGLRGFRLTQTMLEHRQGYHHSHLPFNEELHLPHNYCNFPRQADYNSDKNEFCLGNGDINEMMNNITNEYSIEMFTLILLHIQDYVSWESLEGVPHIKMSCVIGNGNVIEKTTDDITGNTIDDITYKSLQLITDYYNNNEQLKDILTLNIVSDKIIIVNDNKISDFLNDVLRNIYNQYYGVMITENTYTISSEENYEYIEEPYNREHSVFPFRDKLLYHSITEPTERNNEHSLLPYIINKVVEKLTITFNCNNAIITLNEQ